MGRHRLPVMKRRVNVALTLPQDVLLEVDSISRGAKRSRVLAALISQGLEYRKKRILAEDARE